MQPNITEVDITDQAGSSSHVQNMITAAFLVDQIKMETVGSLTDASRPMLQCLHTQQVSQRFRRTKKCIVPADHVVPYAPFNP